MNFDSKIFNPQAFGKYVDRIPNLKRNELLKSGAVKERASLKSLFSEQTGSHYAVVPMHGLIDGEPLNYDGQTDITATATTTFSQGMIVVGRAKGWVEQDFSTDITGGVNFMDNVAQQVAEYWDTVDQDTLLAILKGIFSMTGVKNTAFVSTHTADITDVATGVFDVTTLNTAMQKASGDNKKAFKIALMHSAVATNLENLQLLSYLKYTDANGVQRELEIGTLNGRLVLIDDSMPTEEVAESSAGAGDGYTAYTTYVLGDGAFEYCNVGATVAYEMDRNPAVNGGQNTLYSRQRKVFAPKGISFANKSVATLSPTNAELANGANWEIVKDASGTKTIDTKAIPIARIISKG
ncbi:MAG: phage coat protein [Culicoidibacterales bacterium]